MLKYFVRRNYRNTGTEVAVSNTFAAWSIMLLVGFEYSVATRSERMYLVLSIPKLL
jgi:hypothetical protein